MTDRILDGVRIVELASGLAVPVASRMLAEAGADVIKVEPPQGDPLRERVAFASWNRSKRSAVLDIKTDDGRAKLADLLDTADIFIHEFTPSRAAELRLDDAALRERHPHLIVSSVTGYPIDHSDRDRPAHDLLVQARSGLMGELWGYREGPIAMRFPLPSWAAASLAAAGIVARLIQRDGTGRVGAVHTSLLQGMLNTASLAWNNAENPIPQLILNKYEAPPQLAMYQCSDGVWLQMMNPGERIDVGAIPLVKEVATELGGDLSDLSRNASEDLRMVIAQRPSTEWLPVLRAADLGIEPALQMGELLRDPQVTANGYVAEVDDPTYGKTIQAGSPFGIDPPCAVTRPAPLLGEHTDEVFAELGSSPAANVIRPDDAVDPRPLAGLKVLDLGSFLAGPMAPMLMADLGAEVIKVEPVVGDRLRYKPSYWEACSRNKRSLAVDLTTEQGQAVLHKLVEWADVVHHNQRPKASAKLHIDEAGLRALKPDIVFGYVTSYGENGDRADSPGFDSIFQALAGWEVENGGIGNPPQFSRFGVLDVQTALGSLTGTLLAVYHKQRTGRGTKASGSLLASATATQSETLIRLADNSVAEYPRFDATQTGFGPGRRIYEVADGWVAVVAEAGGQLAALRAIAGAADDDGIEAGLAAFESEKLLVELASAGIAAEPVREEYSFEFFDDEANRTGQLIATYDHAHFGRMEQPGAYWNFDDLTLQFHRAAPVIGQHTREILAELGHSESEVEKMYADRVAGGPSVPKMWEHE
ncbi:CoA transferase [Rhodococcus artemisiae]|uniref:CoA transferase n=1 Tax=Rhodococcus artemisiae TaxID=714159 RepID=A0ABU7L795_9NOCA|nr:CoA transferase [Rhodococcus artemisiae]MEE2057217.1 CoA transferase [Rhodococcus artemisiae]